MGSKSSSRLDSAQGRPICRTRALGGPLPVAEISPEADDPLPPHAPRPPRRSVPDVATRVAIGGDIVGLTRNVEREKVRAREPRDDMRRHAIHHRAIREIGERMAERRKLLVEHREDARLGRMEDHIVAAKIAMDDGALVVLGDAPGKLRHEPVHVRVASGFGRY
jgi:hypothetical protein